MKLRKLVCQIAVEMDFAKPLELSESQKGMLHTSLLGGQHSAYVLQLVVPLKPKVTCSEWFHCWLELVRETPILRLTYSDGVYSLSDRELSHDDGLHLHHFGDLGSAEADDSIALFTDSARDAGFTSDEQGCARFWRCDWFECHGGSTWSLTIHHALLDGNALEPLLNRIVQLLDERAAVSTNENDFFMHVFQPSEAQKSEAKNYFLGCSKPEGWTGHIRPCFAKYDESSAPKKKHRVRLFRHKGSDLDLESVARRYRVSVGVLIHAAWAVVLSRLSRDAKVEIGVIRHCRGREYELGDVIGPLANLLPFKVEVDDSATIKEWLRCVKADWRALATHERFSLREIQDLTGDGKLNGTWPFDSVINHLEVPYAELINETLGALAAAPSRFRQNTDIPCAVNFFSRRISESHLVTDAVAFTRPATELMAESLKSVITQLASGKSTMVYELELPCPAPEPQAVARPEAFTDTNVLTMLADVARRHPDALAIKSGTKNLSYKMLWRDIEVCGAFLQSRGIQPGDLVAILTGPSHETIVCQFAALAVGGAFFVVDQDLPLMARIELIKRSGAGFIRSTDKTVDLYETHLPDACVFSGTNAETSTIKIAEIAASDMAYLVSTSGTTGQPKLNIIHHGALTNMILGYAEVLLPKAGDFRLQSATAASDTFILEVMLYLCHGAGLYLHPQLVLKGFSTFNQILEEQEITIVGLPSSVWREWILHNRKSPGSQLPTKLRAVVCTMEKTDPKLLIEWRREKGNSLLWINAYGPSEATCVTTLHALHPGEIPAPGEIPIGKPLPNTNVYVLDHQLRPLPPGVIGEIAIGGAGVGLGYLDDTVQTEKKFRPDPFTDQQSRLYLSGDQGYWNDLGELVFVGRKDNQVKIRGYRIELEGIDSVLVQLEGIDDAAAVVVGEGGLNQLIAFYVSKQTLCPAALLSALRERLPKESIPTRFIAIEKIPRNALGKIERAALAPEGGMVLQDTENDAQPISDDSNLDIVRVASLFRRALGNSALDNADDFFLFGGDSLKALSLLTDLEKAYGITVSVPDLIAHPTAQGLYSCIKKRQSSGDPGCDPDFHLMPLSQAETSDLGMDVIIGICFSGGSLTRYRDLADSLDDRIAFLCLEMSTSLYDQDAPTPNAVDNLINRCAVFLQEQEALHGRQIHLIGYSSVALIAHQMARSFNSDQLKIKTTLLIEPPMNRAVVAGQAGLLQLLHKAKLRLFHGHGLKLNERLQLVSQGFLSKLKREKEGNESNDFPDDHELNAATMERCDFYRQLNEKLAFDLKLDRSRKRTILFRSLDGHHYSHFRDYETYWNDLCADLTPVDLVGAHPDLLKKPQVKMIAVAITKWIPLR